MYVYRLSFLGRGELCAVRLADGWLVLMEGSRVGEFIQFLECGGEIDDNVDAVCCLYALPVVGWRIWC